MARFLIFTLISFTVLFALDYFVYRRWKAFAWKRGRFFRLSVQIYRVLLWVMPVTLPLYFLVSSWWEVEPKLPRAVLIGFWAIYYLPKVPICLVLDVFALGRLARRLIDRFRKTPPAPEAAPPATIPAGADSSMMTRAEFLQKVGWSAASVPFIIVGYGVIRQLYDFQIHSVDLAIRNLPRGLEGLRIAQISDLHAGSLFSPDPMNEVASFIHSHRPDLVTITGDFVNHDAAEMPVIVPALNSLRADLGVYGCLGNHDHYADVASLVPQIKSTPVNLLVNEHRTISIDGARLHLIGTDNTGFRQNFADLGQATAGIGPAEEGIDFQILMAHDPTFWDTHVRPGYPDIDLMLCGHTHGGQIGFEFGPIRFGLARLVYDRWAGLYTESGKTEGRPQYLYVNRGVGTVGPPIRIGIRPEITMITLRQA